MFKIAVVDDEPKILNGIVFMLKELFAEQAEIAGFLNAKELLEQDGKIDILITDICMPEMDGIVMGGIMKEKYPESRIVIISGYESFDYARRAIHLQAAEYLLKPIDRNQLQTVIINLMEELYREKSNPDSQDFRQMQKEQLLYRVMLQDNAEAKEMLKQYYNTMQIDCYLCIVECQKGPSETIAFDFRNWLYHRLEEVDEKTEIIQILDSRMVIVFYEKKRLPIGFFQQWIEDFYEYHNPLSIGISNVSHDLQTLHQCYREAFIALKTELYKGKTTHISLKKKMKWILI